MATRIKAPSSATMVFLYDLCYIKTGKITSLEGDFPSNDLIWGLYNPLILSTLLISPPLLLLFHSSLNIQHHCYSCCYPFILNLSSQPSPLLLHCLWVSICKHFAALLGCVERLSGCSGSVRKFQGCFHEVIPNAVW